MKVVVLNTVWLLKCSISFFLNKGFMLSLLHSVLYLAVLFFLFSVFRNRGFFFTGLVYSFSSYNYYFHDIFQAVFHCVYKIYDSIRFMFQNSKISRTGDDFNYDSIAFIQDLFDYLLGGSWISQSDSGLSFIQELITTQSVLKKRILDLVFLLLCKNVTMLFDDRMLPKYSVTATLQVCVLLLKFDWIGAMAILVLLLLMGWLHPAMYISVCR